MVTNKQTKRKRDIKNKLMAAICMLLVSSIMMVSTTYAWFTLSTAPEVTGISTAVGANGNLEIALLPTSGATDDITSTAGDGNEAWDIKNNTWGNLVDLSFATDSGNYYGLDKIVLAPAALNVATKTNDGTDNPATLNSAYLLKTPVYGSDGRVTTLKENAITSTYDTSSQNFPQNKEFGVRAVGVASGMTDRQLAYNSALSASNTAKSQAITGAKQSLYNNGSDLANIAITHGTASAEKPETYTISDVNKLAAMVADLDAAVQHIENAYKNYIIAIIASAAGQEKVDDEAFKNFQTAAAGKTVYEVRDTLLNGVTLHGDLTDAIGEVEKTRGAITSAASSIEALQAKETATAGYEYSWSEISAPLKALADPEAMLINGKEAGDIKNNLQNIVDDVAAGRGISATIASGGGVYADIADHCKDYDASINISGVVYNGMTVPTMKATMKTASEIAPPYLDQVSAIFTATNTSFGSPTNSADGGQVMPISEMYGYVVDLAFRTNAADSNLLLQIDGKDRIYTTSNTDTTSDTWGGGSTMTFSAVTPDFTAEQIIGLMGAIRIVFYDPDSYAVMGTAKLDVSANNITIEGGNTVTAKMYMYELTAGGQESYNAASSELVAAVIAGTDKTELYTQDAPSYTAVAKENVTAGGTYYTLTDEAYSPASADTVNAVIDGTDTTTLYTLNAATYTKATTVEATGTYYTKTVTAAGENIKTDNVITSLNQNVAQKVSVLVYLDGENIGNDDVAATASQSVTGTMNLQFASSANLVPMEYTSLKNQSASTETPTEATTATDPSETTGN